MNSKEIYIHRHAYTKHHNIKILLHIISTTTVAFKFSFS